MHLLSLTSLMKLKNNEVFEKESISKFQHKDGQSIEPEYL